jgi:hypothetical protein
MPQAFKMQQYRGSLTRCDIFLVNWKKKSMVHIFSLVQLLPTTMSAIYAQISASHKTASVAQHEEHGRAKLICCTQTVQHIISSPLSLHAWFL